MEDAKLTVRSVERALDILLCFTTSTDLSLTEIAQRISLHKSTVHRLLASLESKGFVLRDTSTDRYRLGYSVWELSANLTHSDEPALILLPEMERLRDLVGETVSLYVRDGLERVRIQAVQSNHPVRRVAPVGARLPLSVGASSKVLVAYAEPHVLEKLLASPGFPDTIDRASFIEQMAEIHTVGYAMSFEEREPGVNAIASPIFDRNSKLFAALSMSGPASRWTSEQMQRNSENIMAFAHRMGNMIG